MIDGGALVQKIPAYPNEVVNLKLTYRLAGDLSSGWAGFGIDYFADGAEGGEVSYQITQQENDFVTFELEGLTEATTDEIQVWMFTSGEYEFVIDNVEVIWPDCDQIEPAPTPTLEATPTLEPTAVGTPTIKPTISATPTAPSNPEPPQNAQYIYDDALSSNWSIGNWGTANHNPKSTAEIYNGDYSLSTDLISDTGILYFKADESFRVKDFDRLSFMIKGTTHQFELIIFDGGFTEVATLDLGSLNSEWREIVLDLTELTGNQEMRYITLRDLNGPNGDFFIDDF